MKLITYADLTVGRVFELGSVVVDHDEMLAFNKRFDPQPFHTDEKAGAESILGGMCASGWFTAGLWMRAYVETVLSNAAALGSPGGSDIRWPAPVYPGDKLDMRVEVEAARLSRSRPEMGLVQLTGTSWRGSDLVLSFTFTGMFGVA
ncbi:MaoC family dehydratase [Streptomyces malaysiensis]|uniref:MaoC family dehydratase n=1 Tax=Streptomyces malaysiensis TaxID=92644 RepID=UPI0033FD4558